MKQITKQNTIKKSSTKVSESQIKPQDLKQAVSKQSVFRNQSHWQSIFHSLKQNRFFIEIGFNQQQLIDIMPQMEIKNIETATKINFLQNEIILVISGQGYQYIQNSGNNDKCKRQNKSSKGKPQYILIKKLKLNDYFTMYLPKIKCTFQQKLIAQKNSVIAIIKQNVFNKYFREKLDIYMHEKYNFLIKFDIIKPFQNYLVYEITKYLQQIIVKSSTLIYKKGEISDYLYFIKTGQIQLKQESQIYKMPYNQTKFKENQKRNIKIANLGPNHAFGVDGIILNISAEYREYTAQAKIDSHLYKIDKRALIVLISCLNQNIGKSELKQINLSDQVSYNFIQKQQNIILAENVRRIKSAQKLIKQSNTKGFQIIKEKKRTLFNNKIVNQSIHDQFSDYCLGINHRRIQGKIQSQSHLYNSKGNNQLIQSEDYSEQKSPNKMMYSSVPIEKNKINTQETNERIRTTSSQSNYKSSSNERRLKWQQSQRRKIRQFEQKLLLNKIQNFMISNPKQTEQIYRRSIKNNNKKILIFNQNVKKNRNNIIFIQD